MVLVLPAVGCLRCAEYLPSDGYACFCWNQRVIICMDQLRPLKWQLRKGCHNLVIKNWIQGMAPFTYRLETDHNMNVLKRTWDVEGKRTKACQFGWLVHARLINVHRAIARWCWALNANTKSVICGEQQIGHDTEDGWMSFEVEMQPRCAMDISMACIGLRVKMETLFVFSLIQNWE